MIPSELSLFHQVLVQIENIPKATKDDIRALGRPRQTLGALGRLEGMGYVKRVENERRSYFHLTPAGDEYLANLLVRVPDQSRQWDEKWRIFVFDLPDTDTKRTSRQLLRHRLLALGARMLNSNVWIAAHRIVVDQFTQVVDRQYGNMPIYIFEAKTVNQRLIDIGRLWNLKHLAREYDKLFKHFAIVYHQLPHRRDSSFIAKCLILQLALVARQDPQLPSRFLTDPWIGNEAAQWHEKLRTFCS